MGLSGWRVIFLYGLASKVSIVSHRRGQIIGFSTRGKWTRFSTGGKWTRFSTRGKWECVVPDAGLYQKFFLFAWGVSVGTRVRFNVETGENG